MINRPFARTLLIVAAVIGVSACTVSPTRVSLSGPAMIVWAPVAPPPPRVEVMPPPPRHDYIWIPGYWHWEASRHRWVDGHWEPHREHEHWVPHHWEHDDRGQWRLDSGYWRRD